MTAKGPYSYDSSVKSDISDELINTYLLRPVAGLLVRILYNTSTTPNQVTIAAIVFGLLAALLYSFDIPIMTMLAGVSLTAKDLLDSADGQLARAKQLYSRAGRFLDSIGDFVVNAFVFAAIGIALGRATQDANSIALAALGFFGITLRVSYHVFYQTSYLRLHDTYALNRVTEEIRAEDRLADIRTLRLQSVFLFLYGWQDVIMVKLDTWCRHGLPRARRADERWFDDRIGLRLSGSLGMGTELFLLTACSVFNKLHWYLYANLIALNGVWLINILYRKCILARRLRDD
jgi:phosphatidylglycerophosphate synthase